MPALPAFHLRRLARYQKQQPSDWPGSGEMRERWYPLWWLMRSPVFSEMQVARLVALKEDFRQGKGWG